MKLVYLTTLYPIYLQKFYGNRPELVNQNFQKQKDILLYDAFGWADFWKNALTPLGYDVIEIMANVKPLQARWAIENNYNAFTEKDWVLKISFEQIRRIQPTILFIDDYHTFPAQWIAYLREQCPSIKLVLGWCGAPYQNETVFKEYDVVLSCIPELVKRFLDCGHTSYHLNHAFDSRILEKIKTDEVKERIDLSFVGQILLSNNYHVERAKLLEEITKHFGISIFSPMFEMQQKLKSLVPYLKPSVFGLEMFKTLINSNITINSHIDVSANSASNMRLFEATGVGTCLITDWKQNLPSLFEPDKEVIVFKSSAECVDKIKWLIDNPQFVKNVAAAGQKRTLKDHNFSQRAVILDSIIREELSKKQKIAKKNVLQYGFFGNYASWNEAQSESRGYDANNILEKVKGALLKVKKGEAVYERDSVLFNKVQYSWPLLSALLWCATKKNNHLNLIDYGGSLGSTYFQNKMFLQHLDKLSWNIIEQPQFVQTGKLYFEDDNLKFFESLEDCLQSRKIDVVLLSSVIQYFDSPYEYLKKIIDCGFQTIIIDRTPFLLEGDDRLTVQKVPPQIYEASYPAWFLNVNKFLSFMSERYKLVADFRALDHSNVEKSMYLGFVFEKKKKHNNFCTLFDSAYLTRGITMYNSLKKEDEDAKLYVVCFDEDSFLILEKMNLPDLYILRITDMENEEMSQVKKERTKGEYCWTCTPHIIKWILEKYELEEVTYLDADLYFFNNPQVLLNEFRKSGASVGISPHNFSAVYKWQEKRAGIYCVQFMTFKSDEHGMKVLNWWRDKCIEWCFSYFDEENERFGDQKYLDRWTEIFEKVYVYNHEGAGVAPWNLQNCRLKSEGDTISVNGSPVIFAHYHGFKWLNDNRIMLTSYHIQADAVEKLYIPYIKALQGQTKIVKEIIPDFDKDRERVSDTSISFEAPKSIMFRLLG